MEKLISRPASGDDAVLMKACEAITSAQTVEPLRQAQAVVLPLDYATSLADTAQVIGVSPWWACQLRKRFNPNFSLELQGGLAATEVAGKSNDLA